MCPNIYEEYDAFRDSDGLTQIDTNPVIVSQNGPRWTAEELAAHVHNNTLTQERRDLLLQAFKNCELEPGLLVRSPQRKEDQEGPDDYYAAIYASKILDNGDLARRILKRGEKVGANKFDISMEPERYYNVWKFTIDNRKLSKAIYFILTLGGLRRAKYVWNNERPEYFTLEAFLGRQIPMLCQLDIVAKGKTTLFRKLVFALVLYFSAKSARRPQDHYALSFFQVESVKGRSWILDKAIAFWHKRMKEEWPNGLGEMLSGFHRNPSGRWLLGKIGGEL